MNTAILEELGLSKGEIKVYITLLKIGTTKVGAIIEKSEMASSAVHNSLNTLLNKGLISYIKKGKIKLYQSTPPKQIINLVENKLKVFKDILPELENLQRESENKQEAEVFEGIKGISSALDLVIESTPKGKDYLFFVSKQPGKDKEIQKFYEKYDLKRKEAGLYIKGIVSKDMLPYFKKRPKYLNIRFTNLPMPENLTIVENNVIIVSWDEKPIAFLLHSKNIADIYRRLFNQIWDLSKK